MRISNEEIEGAIELYVNSVYDLKEESGWMTASLQEWEDAVYKELTEWKTTGGCSRQSKENRFDGGKQIRARIKPLLAGRIRGLKAEGYNIKAYEEIK